MQIKILSSYIENGDIPHLLFLGKITEDKDLVAELFAKELSNKFGLPHTSIFCSEPLTEEEREMVKKAKRDANGEKRLLNPFIEARVKPFIKNRSITNSPRILIFHDFDQLDRGQEAFRRIIEQYSDISRMIFIVKDENNVIVPISSRCVEIRFGYPDISGTIGLFKKMLEGKISEGAVKRALSLVGGSVFMADLLVSATISKYGKADERLLSLSYKKHNVMSVIIKNILSSRYSDALSFAKQSISSTYVSWRDFSEAFLKALVSSRSEQRRDLLLLLSEFDANYNGQDLLYYLSYFILSAKERCKK